MSNQVHEEDRRSDDSELDEIEAKILKTSDASPPSFVNIVHHDRHSFDLSSHAARVALQASVSSGSGGGGGGGGGGSTHPFLSVTNSISYIELDSNLVASYLDTHPEFLSEYLRRSQIQRRLSILGDKSQVPVFANFRMHAQLSELDQQEGIGGGGGGGANVSSLNLSQQPIHVFKKYSTPTLKIDSAFLSNTCNKQPYLNTV